MRFMFFYKENCADIVSSVCEVLTVRLVKALTSQYIGAIK